MSISLENVTVVTMGESIVTDVSLTVERGSINVLLGPTLAGKTTLMRLMAGLDRPTGGRILVDGKDATGVPVRERSVAMVYQQFMNYPSLTVYENIASPLRVARLKGDEIDRRVRRAAGVLGLEPLLGRLPHQLSGGQQQRTAIARAIVKNADLVLFDEPLANLDYKLREELREELPSILREAGSILVYATTEPLEALLLGGLTATLSQGRLVQFGPTPRVYHAPSSIDSARVFSDPPLNEITVIKQDGSLRLGQDLVVPAVGVTAAISDGVYRVGFRGDLARIGMAWPASISLSGRVALAEISGSETFVHVETGLGTFVCVERGVSMRQPGQPVVLHVDADRAFVFDDTGSPVVIAPSA
ncbi:MAG: ABC transporter ATP-binding protein [Xanthobacteraceae bacterium]|jgi:glycerol transport system ATP-binding protein